MTAASPYREFGTSRWQLRKQDTSKQQAKRCDINNKRRMARRRTLCPNGSLSCPGCKLLTNDGRGALPGTSPSCRSVCATRVEITPALRCYFLDLCFAWQASSQRIMQFAFLPDIDPTLQRLVRHQSVQPPPPLRKSGKNAKPQS